MAKPEHQATNPPYEYRSRQGSLGPITGSSLPRLCRLRCDSSRHEFSHRWSTQVSRTEFLISANRPFPSGTNHCHCVCARYATATSRPEQVLVRYQVASLPLGGQRCWNANCAAQLCPPANASSGQSGQCLPERHQRRRQNGHYLRTAPQSSLVVGPGGLGSPLSGPEQLPGPRVPVLGCVPPAGFPASTDARPQPREHLCSVRKANFCSEPRL